MSDFLPLVNATRSLSEAERPDSRGLIRVAAALSPPTGFGYHLV